MGAFYSLNQKIRSKQYIFNKSPRIKENFKGVKIFKNLIKFLAFFSLYMMAFPDRYLKILNYK